MGLPSLSCELRIIRAKNIELKSNGNLFVRCYLSVGKRNSNRVRLDSKVNTSKSNLCWNESFSLECSGSQDSMNMLMQGSIVLELRRRSTVPVLGKIGGSHLLGRAEIPWKTVAESPDMEIEKWVVMISKGKLLHEDVKPPAVQVAMKVQVPAVTETQLRRRRHGRVANWDECGCMDIGCNCADYEMFALAAGLDAF